ncbi:MAG: radical SAM family heme chaperone HemW [Lachnospiraceae bacterium]|nr:radical SAM family heme chaperone HemW [Lachnospiraceae bacterium]
MKNNLEIYIHIPFCVRKCRYCDFLSAPADDETKEKYVKALINEIKAYGKILSKKQLKVDSIFIGGGTPSVLEAGDMAEILSTVRNEFEFDSPEITIEVNPKTVDQDKLSSYRKSGINRLSIGLQSANDSELTELGRIHTYEDFLDTYNWAMECGFENINIDIMSALPYQTKESYEKTVREIVRLMPKHISAYSLIVEDGTPLKEEVEKANRRGEDILPDEDTEREMYELTEQILKEAGYHRYEISNYAVDKSHRCRHNVGYWQRKNYLGFGIGAASLLGNLRYNNIDDVSDYIKIWSEYEKTDGYLNEETIEKADGNVKIEELISKTRTNILELSENDEMEEFMFLGLRMMEGISKEQFRESFGKDIEKVYGDVIDDLTNKKMIEEEDGFIRLTKRGIDVSNMVLSEFLL